VSNYDYDDLPGYNTHVYRQQFDKNYFFNTFLRKVFLKRMSEFIPSYLRHELLFKYDQDHALVLGEGTKHGLFQSIMMKPPNV
jgi:signal-transduction protein with cAMP-binding, CBS, and nucleotidyltransferase domain